VDIAGRRVRRVSVAEAAEVGWAAGTELLPNIDPAAKIAL
jgi:hypothetical protein